MTEEHLPLPDFTKPKDKQTEKRRALLLVEKKRATRLHDFLNTVTHQLWLDCPVCKASYRLFGAQTHNCIDSCPASSRCVRFDDRRQLFSNQVAGFARFLNELLSDIDSELQELGAND